LIHPLTMDLEKVLIKKYRAGPQNVILFGMTHKKVD
jgi:hypothetical protein